MAKNRTETAQPLEPGRSLVPSLLATPQLPADDVADAFGGGIATQPRNEPKSLPLIRIDHRARKFDFSGELMDSVEGYPVHWFQARAYWEQGYRAGEHHPPDCWSPDGTKPSDRSGAKQADSCLECPWSKFGSAAVGKGQMCKTQTLLFIVNPVFGAVPLACLILPPTSIRPLLGGARTGGYLQRARGFKDPQSGRLARYHELVWTRFALETPAEGAIYCTIRPEPLGVCPNVTEAKALAELRGRFVTAMEAMRGEMPSVAVGEDVGE